jgi:hypothetical protein
MYSSMCILFSSKICLSISAMDYSSSLIFSAPFFRVSTPPSSYP